jgi:DNA-binding transcriptional regulator YdaS (Cro superfamily)
MSEALLKAVSIIGSRVRLADAIGTTVEVLKSWINTGIRVPLEYALGIQYVTQGQVTWQEISPHLTHFNFC